MSATAIRGKDWVFNALWAAADLPKKCALNIPLTCIFKEGMPFKTLCTDPAGNIRRVDLDKVDLDRLSYVNTFRGDDMRRLLALRKILEERAREANYAALQRNTGEEPKLVKVRGRAPLPLFLLSL